MDEVFFSHQSAKVLKSRAVFINQIHGIPIQHLKMGWLHRHDIHVAFFFGKVTHIIGDKLTCFNELDNMFFVIIGYGIYKKTMVNKANLVAIAPFFYQILVACQRLFPYKGSNKLHFPRKKVTF